jgi:uncharacterized membrane protein
MYHIDKHSYEYLIGICAFVVILLILFSYYYWTLGDQMMMKLGTYIQIITVFMLIITSIIAVMTFKYNLDDRHRTSSLQYANMTQNEINDIEKMFMSNPLLDRLYFEIYAHTPHIQKIIQLKGIPKETPDMLKQEQHMANIIFQKIADIYFCEQLETNTPIDSVEWLNTFRIWMKSPILRSHWQYLKYEHHPTVQEFVDRFVLTNSSGRPEA